MTLGHLFVVHSRMEDLQYDAALVPTGRTLGVRSYWQAVLKVPRLPHDPTHLDTTGIRPADWPQPFARIPVSPGRGPTVPTWFINSGSTGRYPKDRVANLMSNLAGALRAIADSSIRPGTGRAKPLVALPTLGVGGGGLNAIRGAVIDRLLAECQSFVEANDIDLVITAMNPSDYAAFQHQRRKLDAFPTLSPTLQTHGRRLADLARGDHLALFLGAGVSIPAGLPSWPDLLNHLREKSRTSQAELDSLDSPLDKAELLQRRLGGSEALKDHIAAFFKDTKTPGMSHLQLAALQCGEVITTNYDSLFETAVNSMRPDDDSMTVLPFEQKKPFRDWILKMHGDIRHPGKVVLSRSDFVGYSAAAGPVGAIVQALMLTRHLLVVGTSLTDDNLLRLAYEVTNYLQSNPPADGAASSEIGTVLSLKTDPAKQALWEGTFTVLGVADAGDSQEVQARALSIMLDYIAMHAAKDDWLLDPRYAALLDPAEQHVAEAARQLREKVKNLTTRTDGASAGWTRLDSVLTDLGASDGT